MDNLNIRHRTQVDLLLPSLTSLVREWRPCTYNVKFERSANASLLVGDDINFATSITRAGKVSRSERLMYCPASRFWPVEALFLA